MGKDNNGKNIYVRNERYYKKGGAFNQGIVIGRIERSYAWGGSKEGSFKGPERESKAAGERGASR